MWNTILIFHVLISATLVGLVLLQQGKGADAGAAFGSGASQTVFGSRGSGSFLTRTTAVMAALFFVTSLSLAYLSRDKALERNSSLPPIPSFPVPAQPLSVPSGNAPPSVNDGSAAGQDPSSGGGGAPSAASNESTAAGNSPRRTAPAPAPAPTSE